jgi:hypothetical protein
LVLGTQHVMNHVNDASVVVAVMEYYLLVYNIIKSEQ